MAMGRVLLGCLAMLLAEVSEGGALPSGFKIDPPVNTIQITPANGAMRAFAIVPIKGEITPSRYLSVADTLKGFQGAVFVQLDSPGGDVGVAISLGRLFRALRASVIVLTDGDCASACIFIYAGGSERSLDPGAKLIIHRPYLTGAATGDEAETRSKYEEMRSAVTKYLSDMNVSPELFDVMQVIPPADQRVLSDVDAKHYGLIALDPVEEEIRVDEFAHRSGISREDYRRRADLVSRLCGNNDLSPKWYACSAKINQK